jgi:hypothetical protein
MYLFPKMVESKKVMVPLESALQKHSNEWSCQYILAILPFWAVSLSFLPLVTEVTISRELITSKLYF